MNKKVKKEMDNQFRMVELEIKEMEEELEEGVGSRDIWEFRLYMISDKIDFLVASWAGGTVEGSKEEEEIQGKVEDLLGRVRNLFEIGIVRESVLKEVDKVKEGEWDREKWEDIVDIKEMERGFNKGRGDEEVFIHGKVTSGQFRVLADMVRGYEEDKREAWAKEFIERREGLEDLGILERWIVGKLLK